jgi:hypothetical protein
LPQAELTLKDDPVTASLKPAVMRSTLSELGAPLDDGEGGTLGRAASMLQRNNVESVSPSIFSFYTLDVWSELVGDSDEPLEYDIWLKSESIETCFFFSPLLDILEVLLNILLPTNRPSFSCNLAEMKSTGFSALNKAQNGANRSSTLGRSSTMLSPNAKGKIDFSQVAKIR